MTDLHTRPATGQVAYPLLLLEGEEKAGKSVAAYKLSASAKVGRTFVIELGEGSADEYAELGPYEIVIHNGTFTDIFEQLRAACAEPMVDGCPNVVILDDATALWDLLKDWTGGRARNSRNGRKKLAEDPDAELDISMNLWNDAKDRWYSVVNLLRVWPGIGVLIARGKEVSKVVGGQPVAGETEWKVDAEKGTAFAASAWVRMTRPHVATLIAARSLHVDVPAKGLALPAEDPLEHLVFEVLGAGGDFAPSTRVAPSVGRPAAEAKTKLLEYLGRAGLDENTARAEAIAAWAAEGLGAEVTEPEWARLIDSIDRRLAELADGAPESDGQPTTDDAPAGPRDSGTQPEPTDEEPG